MVITMFLSALALATAVGVPVPGRPPSVRSAEREGPGATMLEPSATVTGASLGRPALEVMQRVNDLMRGTSSHSVMSLTITTPDWTRTLKVRVWTEGRTKALIRIVDPAKDAGTGSLRLGTQMWNYLPRDERVIKVPPSMMMQGWMGSDFSYQDMVKSDSLIVDYAHHLLKRTVEGARVTYVVQGDPRPDAPVVWGRIVMTAVEEGPDLYPVREEDYNERGELARTLAFGDVKRFGGMLRPARIEVTPLKRPGRKTTIVTHELVFGGTLGEGFFGLKTLEQQREDRLWTPPAP